MDSNLTLHGVWDVFKVFFRLETHETQQRCQLRWEQVNLCQRLESGEFICKNTQPPRKCAVLAWAGRGTACRIKTSHFCPWYALSFTDVSRKIFAVPKMAKGVCRRQPVAQRLGSFLQFIYSDLLTHWKLKDLFTCLLSLNKDALKLTIFQAWC